MIQSSLERQILNFFESNLNGIFFVNYFMLVKPEKIYAYYKYNMRLRDTLSVFNASRVILDLDGSTRRKLAFWQYFPMVMLLYILHGVYHIDILN